MSRESRVSRDVIAAFPGVPEGSISARAFDGLDFQRHMDDQAIASIVTFLRTEFTRMEAAGLHDVVLGLSGGLDSVVVVRLCQLAAEGARQVYAVTVDLGRPGEAARAAAIARSAGSLGVRHRLIDGRACRQTMLDASPARGPWSDINTDTRLIHGFIFRAADADSCSVVSTVDYSENLLGRHTEGFYGQLEPLGSTYKTEVRELAKSLGVLDCLSDVRPGCEDYWYDDEVLGVGYDVIDPILYLLVEQQRMPQWISEHFGIADVGWIERLARRVAIQPLRLETRCPEVANRFLRQQRDENGSANLRSQ